VQTPVPSVRANARPPRLDVSRTAHRFNDHAPVTEPRQPAPVPTLALRVEHAAASFGLSESAFRRDVLPNVRSVKVGRVRVVAVIELERWLYLNGRL
jgi:hypothetical protein